MDTETIDREMSSWMVSCIKNGTRFYLTGEGIGTDIRSRGAIYRYLDRAEIIALLARTEEAWRGFDWRATSVPETHIPIKILTED